jgi:hypothetical protein
MLKINLRNEELSHSYIFSCKELALETLQKYFLKKLNISSEWNILFFDIDEHLIFNNWQVLRGEKEYNLQIFKHKQFQETNINSEIEKLNLSNIIKNVTGAKNELIPMKKSNQNCQLSKTESTVNNSNFLNFLYYSTNLLLFRSDIEMLNSFQHQLFDMSPDENLLNALVEFGFPLQRARLALIISRNDIIKAADILSNPNYEEIFNTVLNHRQVSYNIKFEN